MEECFQAKANFDAFTLFFQVKFPQTFSSTRRESVLSRRAPRKRPTTSLLIGRRAENHLAEKEKRPNETREQLGSPRSYLIHRFAVVVIRLEHVRRETLSGLQIRLALETEQRQRWTAIDDDGSLSPSRRSFVGFQQFQDCCTLRRDRCWRPMLNGSIGWPVKYPSCTRPKKISSTVLREESRRYQSHFADVVPNFCPFFVVRCTGQRLEETSDNHVVLLSVKTAESDICVDRCIVDAHLEKTTVEFQWDFRLLFVEMIRCDTSDRFNVRVVQFQNVTVMFDALFGIVQTLNSRWNGSSIGRSKSHLIDSSDCLK